MVTKRYSSVLIITLGFLGLLVVGWLNYRFTLLYPASPHFLVAWMGTRALLTEGHSPYGQAAHTQISEIASSWSESGTPAPLIFIFPLYAVIFTLPLAAISDYSVARAIWMLLLELSVVLMMLFSVRLAGWRPKAWVLGLLTLVTLFGAYTVIPVLRGDVAILTGLLVVLALIAIRNEMDELAGLALVFSTVTPHLVLLFLIFVLFWSISHQRWRLVLWTFGSQALLVLGSLLILRDWIPQFVGSLTEYYQLDLLATPGAVFQSWWPGLGSQLGWALTFILALLLGAEWLLAFRKPFRWFIWTACLTLVVGQLLGIRTDPASFIVMLPAMILVFAVWDEQWGRQTGWSLMVINVLLFLLLWSPIVNGWDVYLDPPVLSRMFFPYPAFLLVGLYWIRWRTARPRRLYLDSLRAWEEG